MLSKGYGYGERDSRIAQVTNYAFSINPDAKSTYWCRNGFSNDGYPVWYYIEARGSDVVSSKYTEDKRGVRPACLINYDGQFTAGSGTKEDPFRIE